MPYLPCTIGARHLQEAINSSTLTYGSEITWKGQKGIEKKFQEASNHISRVTLGVLPFTLVAFLSAEGGNILAGARPNQRQEWFAARLCASSHQHHQQILLQNTPLVDRLRTAVGLSKAGIGKVEVISLARGRRLSFPGVIIPSPEGGEKEVRDREALNKAREHGKDEDALWTDGPKLEAGEGG